MELRGRVHPVALPKIYCEHYHIEKAERNDGRLARNRTS